MELTDKLINRFWQKVDKSAGPNQCWTWLACCDRKGYGIFDNHKAHRISWEIINGPIPEGMFVCHHCDNPPCVNVRHLFIGNNFDNMQDRKAKGRYAVAELHPRTHLTNENVREIRERCSNGEAQRAVAKRFNISQRSVGRIVHYQFWKSVI